MLVSPGHTPCRNNLLRNVLLQGVGRQRELLHGTEYDQSCIGLRSGRVCSNAEGRNISTRDRFESVHIELSRLSIHTAGKDLCPWGL